MASAEPVKPKRSDLPRSAKVFVAILAAAAAMACLWLLQRDVVLQPTDTLVILAILTLVFESFPLLGSYRGQTFQFSVGTAFVVAMLTLFGILPAVIIQVAASLIADLRTRKEWPKVVFNAAQFIVTLTVAGLVVEKLLGRKIVYPGLSFNAAELSILLAGLVTFLVMNWTLTAAIIRIVTGWKISDVARRFIAQESFIEASALLLVPLIAVSMQRSPLLGLFLMVPIGALYRATQVGLQNVSLLEDRTRALEEKKATERRFRSLVQNSSDLICLIDPDGAVIYASQSAGEVSGLHLACPNLLDCIHPSDRGTATDALAAVRRSPSPKTLPEIRFVRDRGPTIPAEVVIDNRLDDEDVKGIVLNIRDTSERRILEDQLRQSQKTDAIGQLAGGIAHDFNNLLGAIQGFTQFALEAGPSDESYKNDLKEVLATADRAAQLVRQLLMFSRKGDVQPKLVNMNDAIADLWKLLLASLTEGVDLRFEAARSLLPVKIDPTHLEQVMINLAVNARDAMQGRGVFEIVTSSVPDLDEPDSLGWTRVSFRDSGCGMNDTTMERIFDPFFTTKGRDSGTGLGLATVHGIITSAGGRISVDSAPGTGTTFVIDLPAVLDTPSSRRDEPAIQSPKGTETVLVVEDDQGVGTVVQRILEWAGYRVITTASPQKALLFMADHGWDVDLLLTDVVLPEMTGPELASAVLANNSRTKLLYMSGYTDDLLEQHQVESKAARLMRKPFSRESLLIEVRRSLDEADPEAPEPRELQQA